MRSDLEILAPVGSFESLRAAVQNGANAVYLGGKDFSARASAANFGRDELEEAVKYCHIRGVRLFVTANTIIKQNEVEDFIEYMRFLYNIDVDAVIVQDIGMAMLIKKLMPDFELHASTQMAAHSIEDVKYLKSIGFKRVVLARELTIEEIEYICKNVDVDIEVFVHGALCVCYSGECLMSSMIGNRSGNRGRCAQPCRQKYILEDEETGKIIETEGEYILSPRDLNTVEEIGRIVDAGVLSLKIEGRMKRPEYVATVVSVYRDAVERYINGEKSIVTPEEINELYTIFNRKFTRGYILDEVGLEIMNSEKPNNRGLYIGTVESYNRKSKRLKIKLENNLKKGDGINLGGGTIGRILKGNNICEEGYKGETIEIDFIGDAYIGQKVFKTSDNDLIEKARKTFDENSENVKIPLFMNFEVKIGKPPVLKVYDEDGSSVHVYGDKEAEKAIKVALSSEKAETQLKKLGNTPYKAEYIECSIDDDATIPVSMINSMRREAVERISAERVKINDRKYKFTDISYKSEPRSEEYNSYSTDEKKIRVKLKNLEQLKAVVDFDIDKIYYEDIYTFEAAKDICESNNKKIIYSAPRIMRNDDYRVFEKLEGVITEQDDVLVSSWGEIKYFTEKFGCGIRADWSLNTFNGESAEFMRKSGIKSVCLSQELNIGEIDELEEFTDIETEVCIYGYTPLMISEYCPMGVLVRDCHKEKRCSDCRKIKYSLVDSSGNRYRLSQNEFCRTTIYNSEPTMILNNIEDIENTDTDVFRLDFTIESGELTREVVKAHIEAIEENMYSADKIYERFDNITTGHFYRGVE
ncbi:U32 family peptidase [Peptacetobacter hominis]|uniref:U32 family peptidase n=1 Tax=Peptacetobacter hominis TaxID=2743610 RepID=A0A544QVW9_9FIRM|nr:U32 family peptidase [Peptacetobacter hominis]TQQ84835.1 U32 family peptidase [Peptacetobacter hominis]